MFTETWLFIRILSLQQIYCYRIIEHFVLREMEKVSKSLVSRHELYQAHMIKGE